MLKLLRSQHLSRYKDIAWLLFRHGRTELVDAGGLQDDAGEGAPGSAKAEELADDLEAMGPTFVKLGQILASRADLLPPPYLEALGRLTDDVEPIPFDDVRGVIEQQLGITLTEWFADFSKTPIAAGSLGQVHRATLTDGREVVIKVQRPGIKKQINDDVAALTEIARLAESHTDFAKRYRVTDVLRQFRRTISAELDYRQEAENLAAVRENLADFDKLIIPEPLLAWTSECVLTMDYVPCESLEAITAERRAKIDGNALAEQLLHAYLKQVVVDGLFHADPHPGNIKLADDGRLVMFDLGMVGRVPPAMQEQLLQLLVAVSEGRSDEAVKVGTRLGYPDDDFNPSMFTERITELVADNHDRNVSQMRTGKLMLEIAQVAGESHLRLPAQITVLGKMLLHLDQIGRLLDENFNPNESIRRHGAEMLQHRVLASLSPKRLFSSLLETRDFLERLPARLDRLIDNLANNKLRMTVDAIDEDRLIHGMQKIANRITAGLVVAALIIGAALLMNIETDLQLFGYPAFALLLFVAAAALGFFLVANILFSDD